MKRLRILCTKKQAGGIFDGDISHIGGVNRTGDKWNISVREAVDGINSGAFELYMVEQFQEINVKVTGEIEKSLTAIGQGYLHNLLRDLPDCP